MDSKPLNLVGDFRDEEEARKESISNRVNKNFLFLVLFLVIIVGVLLWQNPQFGKDYFGKIKAMLFPELSLSEDSGLDLSEINISAFVPDEASSFAKVLEDKLAGKEEEGIGGPLIGELSGGEETLEQEVVVLKKNLTLEEIQQEINIIAKEVERIDKEVQILVALSEI